jgi:hypothetical protein
MPPLISTFPALPLTNGATVVWEAWTPDGSAQVSGVVITDPVLYGLNLTPQDDGATLTSVETPLWLPIPTDELNATDDEETEAPVEQPV